MLRLSNHRKKPSMLGFMNWMFSFPVSFLTSHCFTSLLWNKFIEHISDSWMDYSPSPLVLFTFYFLYLEYIPYSHSNLINSYTHFNSSLQMLLFLGRCSWSLPSLIWVIIWLSLLRDLIAPCSFVITAPILLYGKCLLSFFLLLNVELSLDKDCFSCLLF